MYYPLLIKLSLMGVHGSVSFDPLDLKAFEGGPRPSRLGRRMISSIGARSLVGRYARWKNLTGRRYPDPGDEGVGERRSGIPK